MSLIAYAGTIIGVTTGLALVLAVLFTQFRKNTSDLLRQDNEDYRRRLETVESHNAECEKRLEELETTTQHMADLLSGAAVVAELATVVSFNHEEVMKRLEIIDRRLSRRRTT